MSVLSRIAGTYVAISNGSKFVVGKVIDADEDAMVILLHDRMVVDFSEASEQNFWLNESDAQTEADLYNKCANDGPVFIHSEANA